MGTRMVNTWSAWIPWSACCKRIRLRTMSPEPTSSRKANAASQAISMEKSRVAPLDPVPRRPLRNTSCRLVRNAIITGATLTSTASSRHRAALNSSTRPLMDTRCMWGSTTGMARAGG